MVGPYGVKNVEALKGLKGPQLKPMIQALRAVLIRKVHGLTISILR
jgi:hypothetical protein